jgi:hypothetical protein
VGLEALPAGSSQQRQATDHRSHTHTNISSSKTKIANSTPVAEAAAKEHHPKALTILVLLPKQVLSPPTTIR